MVEIYFYIKKLKHVQTKREIKYKCLMRNIQSE